MTQVCPNDVTFMDSFGPEDEEGEPAAMNGYAAVVMQHGGAPLAAGSDGLSTDDEAADRSEGEGSFEDGTDGGWETDDGASSEEEEEEEEEGGEDAAEPPTPEAAPCPPAGASPRAGREFEMDEILQTLEGEVPADHLFASEPAVALKPSCLRRQWQALHEGLPRDGSVWVRSYEARMDLLRAVVYGPEGTPYQDVPFCFDIYLPEGFPEVAPKMKSPPLVRCHKAPAHMPTARRRYHSMVRERLNPNLYEDGKVCLSLLGTWNGPGWDSKTSTVLQLLMSVLALVLVEE